MTFLSSMLQFQNIPNLVGSPVIHVVLIPVYWFLRDCRHFGIFVLPFVLSQIVKHAEDLKRRKRKLDANIITPDLHMQLEWGGFHKILSI